MPVFNQFKINEKLLGLIISRKFDHVDNPNPYKVAPAVRTYICPDRPDSYMLWKAHIRRSALLIDKPELVKV